MTARSRLRTTPGKIAASSKCAPGTRSRKRSMETAVPSQETPASVEGEQDGVVDLGEPLHHCHEVLQVLGGGSGVELVALCPAHDLDRRPKPVQGGPDAASAAPPGRRSGGAGHGHAAGDRGRGRNTPPPPAWPATRPARRGSTRAAGPCARPPPRRRQPPPGRRAGPPGGRTSRSPPWSRDREQRKRRARSSCSPNGTPSPNTSRYQSMSRATKGRRNGYSARSFSVRRIPESRMAPSLPGGTRRSAGITRRPPTCAANVLNALSEGP